MNDGSAEHEGNPTPQPEDNKKGEENFISRFFHMQKKNPPAEVAIEHDFMKEAIKPDPSIDSVLAREHGRLNPAGLDLTGKDVTSGTIHGINPKGQAVPSPLLKHEAKPELKQAVSRRELSKRVGRRRVLRSLLVGGAAGAVLAVPAIKTAEAAFKTLAAAAHHPGEQLKKQIADDEAKREKFAKDTNQPFQYNGELMPKPNDNKDLNKP